MSHSEHFLIQACFFPESSDLQRTSEFFQSCRIGIPGRHKSFTSFLDYCFHFLSQLKNFTILFRGDQFDSLKTPFPMVTKFCFVINSKILIRGATLEQCCVTYFDPQDAGTPLKILNGIIYGNSFEKFV